MGVITWSGGSLHGIAALISAPHDILELLVHSREGLGFMGQLALDVRCREDGLQVYPVLLAGRPLIQGIAEQVQLPVYPLHLMPDPAHEPEWSPQTHLRAPGTEPWRDCSCEQF